MNLANPLKVGFSFGITSGIITTLGLLIGLTAGTNSKLVVISGILTIAVADSLSDALGIHISEETDKDHSWRDIWESAASTFLGKFILTLLFIIPVLLFNLQLAVIVSIIYSVITLSLLSIYIAKIRQKPAWELVVEHLVITIVVIVFTYYIGLVINQKLS